MDRGYHLDLKFILSISFKVLKASSIWFRVVPLKNTKKPTKQKTFILRVQRLLVLIFVSHVLKLQKANEHKPL